MHWAVIVFGWPGALTAIGVSFLGLLLRRPILVWAGAIIGLPFMSYLFATPSLFRVGGCIAAHATSPRRPCRLSRFS